MPSVIQFVESMTASPTVRLDLNSASSNLMIDVSGIDLSPPPLRQAVASTMLRDGDHIAAGSFENRKVILPLKLVYAANTDAAASAMQDLARELNRPTNILKVQLQGASEPVFFRTFRSSYALSMLRLLLTENTTITLELPAEPFAYGLLETPVSGVTVSTNPADVINGCFVDVGGGFWLAVPGTTGAYASTPDHASLDITGDLSLRAEATTDQWQSSAEGNKYLLAKYGAASNQRSYALLISTGGFLRLSFSTNGTAVTDATATALMPSASGRYSVRADLDVNNGAGGHTVRFYYANSLSGTWTQLGADVVTAGTVSVHSGTAVLEAGTGDTGNFINFKGRIHAAQVIADPFGTPTVVADPDFTAQTAGVTSFADSTGKTWTVNGTAAIVGTPAIKGDVEAPAVIQWPASTIGGSNHQAMFAVRRRGEPSATPFLIQAESMTQGTNTTVQANDTDMSGAGSNFSRCTFATATMETRLSVTTVGTASTDLRGRYRVFLRYRRSSQVGDVNVRLQWGATTFTLVTNASFVTAGSTTRVADLGEISIPQGWDPERGPDGIELGVSNLLTLQVQAERTSGTPTLDFDFLVLVPADDRVGLVQWNASSVASLDHYRLDAKDNSIHARDASASIRSVPAPSLAGGLPMLSPGQTNRIYMLRNVNAGTVWSLTTTSPVSVSYLPRYLSVKGLST